MRLIDADAYSAEMKQRQEACKEWLSGLADSELQNQAIGTLNAFVEAKLTIDSMPTVDAVPVIRCKDCKWYYRGGATCMFWDGANSMCGDDYCSRAEVKEE